MLAYEKNITRIIDFLLKGFAVSPDVDKNSSINNDLKFSGLDADYFIEKFIEQFSVDMTGFDYNKYFYEEGEQLSINPLKWFKALPKKADLTIEHLAKVIEAGKWLD
jgi:hypothetical protein